MQSEFPSTIWKSVYAAQDGDSVALQSFFKKYHAPVVAYAKKCGLGSEAEDLAQEVFIRFFTGVLEKATPNRGKFRSLVLAVARNVISEHRRKKQTLKRGAGQVVSHSEMDEYALEPDKSFDQEWVRNLLGVALDRLKAEYAEYHTAIASCFLGGKSQKEVADEMGIPTKKVMNLVYKGKKKLITYIKEEVWNYSASKQDYQEEMELLQEYFSKELA